MPTPPPCSSRYGPSPASATRRLLVLAVVVGAAVAQMAWSMIAWVGGADPSAVMVGTFFWHNQFAAFLLAPAVIGAGLAAAGESQLRLPGAIAAVLGSAGVVLSTSRATVGLLVLGWVAAGVIVVLGRGSARARLAAAGRWLALAALSVLVTVTLPGPPLFSNRVSALASTAARGAKESATQNGAFRVDFWKQALAIFRHHPATGTGFDSFGREGSLVDPHGVHSTLVHSGLIQPLSDGGLLLAVPFLLACVLVGLGVLLRLRPAVLGVEGSLVSLVALGSVLLAVHSAMDFDWTYPALMAMSAILAAIALAWSSAPAEPAPAARSRRMVSLAACAVLIVSSLVLAQRAVPGGWHLNAPAPHAPASASPFPGDPAS